MSPSSPARRQGPAPSDSAMVLAIPALADTRAHPPETSCLLIPPPTRGELVLDSPVRRQDQPPPTCAIKAPTCAAAYLRGSAAQDLAIQPATATAGHLSGGITHPDGHRAGRCVGLVESLLPRPRL